MMEGVDNCNGLGLDWSNDKIGEFFTARLNPTSLILPISIVGGIAAAISSFFPPAAVVAGAAAISNGILTEKGLQTIK